MKPALYEPLLQQLKAENQAFRDFINLLQHEAQILSEQYTHEQIHDIAQKKTAWHQQYTRQQTQRQKLLQALELRDSVEVLQDLADQDPAFNEQLQNLLQQAEQAQALNQANGALIHEYLAHHQKALNALEQLQRDQSTSTYDADGKKSSAHIGQSTKTQA